MGSHTEFKRAYSVRSSRLGAESEVFSTVPWVNVEDEQPGIAAAHKGNGRVRAAPPPRDYLLRGRRPALEGLPGDSRDEPTVSVSDDGDGPVDKIEVAQGGLPIEGKEAAWDFEAGTAVETYCEARLW